MNEYVFRTVLAHLNLMKKSSEFVCSPVVYLSMYAVVFYIFTEKLKYMAKLFKGETTNKQPVCK